MIALADRRMHAGAEAPTGPRPCRAIRLCADGVTRYVPNRAVRLLFEACGGPIAELLILKLAGELDLGEIRELHELLGMPVELCESLR